MPNHKLLRCTIRLVAMTALAAAIHPAEGATVIRNARVFDGDAVIDSATVLIRDGRISAIAEVLKSVPEGALEVDATGMTLLPGLIDSHTHSWGTAPQEALNFGVTTVLDMFTEPSLAAAWRREQRAGPVPDRADVFSAGTLVTVTRGHGTQFGIDIPTLDDPEETEAFVTARIAEGSDYIKIIHEAGSARWRFPTFDGDQLKRIAAAAHDGGKLALFHVGTARGADMAVAAGADGLMHVYRDVGGADLVAAIREAGTFVVPTLAVMQSVFGLSNPDALAADPVVSDYLSANGEANLKRLFNQGANPAAMDTALVNVRALFDAGVPILAGTDAANPGVTHGASLHRELELLASAGIPNAEVLRTATSNAAEAFRLHDRGRIAAGKKADLVLVRGDPLQDLATTKDIVAIWKDGVRFERQRHDRTTDRPPQEPSVLGAFNTGTDVAESGWSASTDSFAGGKSTVELSIVAGMGGGGGALRIQGDNARGYAYPWSGAMVNLGSTIMEPVNLGGSGKLAFDARGEGKRYRAMAFAENLGQMPAIVEFKASAQWQRVELPLTGFPGFDPEGAMAFFIGSPSELGPFWLEIDNVALIE
ncbi:MAG: amidohydrolase family protein [Gammaproteobacteria bacterium]|nr:amidohydrolase family protein [Gammaproteobacteria bacterium]